MSGQFDPRALSGPSRLAAAEACSGIALLLFGRSLLDAVARGPSSRRVINIARMLGVRQLLQGLVTVQRPTRRILRLGAAVDALHAATMVAAAAAGVGPRRVTIASAAVAGAFTAAAVSQSRTR